MSGYQNMPRTGTHKTSIKEIENESCTGSHVIEASSATDTDIDEALANNKLDRKSKKVIHRNMKQWNARIESELDNEEEINRLTENSALATKQKKK